MGKPILVVGQGIAGSMISFMLTQHGVEHHVIDPNLNNASKVSSGLINPITGRRYVKSWLVDDLFDTALEVYGEMQHLLRQKIIHHTQIIRGLKNTKEENDWNARTLDAAYERYIGLAEPNIFAAQGLKPLPSYGRVLKGLRIDVSLLVTEYRKHLLAKDQITTDRFNHAQLIVNHDKLSYLGMEYSKVIFCEGWNVKDNPYFNHLHFDPAKGEVLIVKIPNLNLIKPFKNQIFLVPLGDDIYWVGSTYEWQVTDDNPTETKRKQLLENLESILEIPFEIIDHKAGIRPATKNRKPIIGQHPEYADLFLFNGLGTKGASLAPFFAKQMIELIMDDKNVMQEVDLQQY